MEYNRVNRLIILHCIFIFFLQLVFLSFSETSKAWNPIACLISSIYSGILTVWTSVMKTLRHRPLIIVRYWRNLLRQQSCHFTAWQLLADYALYTDPMHGLDLWQNSYIKQSRQAFIWSNWINGSPAQKPAIVAVKGCRKCRWKCVDGSAPAVMLNMTAI